MSWVARASAVKRLRPSSTDSAGTVATCPPSWLARCSVAAIWAFSASLSRAVRGVSICTAVQGARRPSATRLAARTSSAEPGSSLTATTSRSLAAQVPASACVRR